MKKKSYVLVVLATILMSLPAKAQVDLGIKGGLNVSNFSFSKEVFDKSNQAGFFIGPTAKFTLPIVGLGIDVSALYDQRSAELSVYSTNYGQPTDTKVKETIKQQQIAIPINVRYSFGLGDMTSIFLFAGPQFGFNIGDKDKKLFSQIAEWKLKSSNFSINVGLGAMLLGHLQVSANYNFACGKTGEIRIDDVLDKTNANVWQLALAYYF